MAYKLLNIDIQKLAEEVKRYNIVRGYLESGHRDWDNGWHNDGWAQAWNDKLFEKAYRRTEESKIGKRASNLDLTLETVKARKLAKLGAYTDGGTYTDWGSDYWAVYTEY